MKDFSHEENFTFLRNGRKQDFPGRRGIRKATFVPTPEIGFGIRRRGMESKFACYANFVRRTLVLSCRVLSVPGVPNLIYEERYLAGRGRQAAGDEDRGA